MIRLAIQPNSSGELQILCLGAHSDDIEIGCGGTILKLLDQYSGCVFHSVVFSAIETRRVEAEHAAKLFAGSRLNQFESKTFRDGFMPFVGRKVKDTFEDL